MSTVTDRINIEVREDGSVVVKRNLEDIGKSAKKTSNALSLLRKAMTGLMAVFSIRKIVQTVDAFNSMQNILKVTGTRTDQLAASTDRLLQIANRTGQDIGSVTTLYARLSGASKDLGATQNQLFNFVEAVGASLAVNGTEAQTAAGALLQLSQAMGGAVIQAQEFNSLIDGARPLLSVAAQHIDEAGGSVSRLKQMVNDGKLGAKEFFDAVLQGAPELMEKLAQAETLVGQAFVILNNNFTVWLGRSQIAQDMNRILSTGLMWIAENLDSVAAAVIVAATAFGVWYGVPAIINGVTVAWKALTVALNTNPLMLLVTAITAAIAALTLFRDEIKLGIDDTTTLGDLMRAAWQSVAPAINDLWQFISSFFGWLEDDSSKTHDAVSKHAGDSVESQMAWWLELILTVARVFDAIAATVRGTMVAIGRMVSATISFLKKQFAALGDAMSAALSGNWDGVKAAQHGVCQIMLAALLKN